MKPYVLDDQMCDECAGQRCGGKFAPFFCANVTCLQVILYFWSSRKRLVPLVWLKFTYFAELSHEFCNPPSIFGWRGSVL